MASYDKKPMEDEECNYPLEQIKKVHEEVREELEEPTYTTTKKLMKPQDGELEG